MHATVALLLALLSPTIAVAAPTPGVAPGLSAGSSAPTTPGAAAVTSTVGKTAWRYSVTRVNIGCDAFTSPGSAPSDGTPASVTLKRTVTMGDHGTLLISLCSNPTTGYRWTWPAYSHGLLRFVARSYTEPAPGLLGAAGKDLFRFVARQDGTGTIRLTYSQPWAGGQKATWRVTLTVRAMRAAPVARSASTTVTCDQFTAAQDAAGHTAIARTVGASVGGAVTVTLCSNASTGFSWEHPVFDATRIQLLRHATSEPSGLIGAAGKETWTFRVLAAGDTSASFAYSRPWTGGEKGVWIVVLTIRAA
jgi:predicted secreted protein